MILRSLRVSGWRCFAEPWTLGPLGEGLNLVHAPNGSGKSTLFEALRRGLLEAHTLKAEELRPWGRRLAPRVEVEFLQEGVVYLGTKQFLDAPSCLVERLEQGRFVPLAQGTEGDRFLLDLFGGASGRGAAPAVRWGIHQILWAPQGSLPLEPLGEGAAERLKAALGAEAEGPEVRRLREALEAR